MFARNNPGKRRVRFPDEVIFENEIKEQDGEAVMGMLRRASIDIDINRINSAGRCSNKNSDGRLVWLLSGAESDVNRSHPFGANDQCLKYYEEGKRPTGREI